MDLRGGLGMSVYVQERFYVFELLLDLEKMYVVEFARVVMLILYMEAVSKG